MTKLTTEINMSNDDNRKLTERQTKLVDQIRNMSD